VGSREWGVARRGSVRIGGVLFAVAVAWACGDDEPAASTADASVTPGADGSASDDATSRAQTDAADDSATVGGRPYGVTVPTTYDPTAPTPLVVLLHGYQLTAQRQDHYFKLSALAQTKKFLVALPNGMKDPLGNQMWNATDACCNYANVNVDDVAFLHGVIVDMKARYNVDPKRVYVIGHSNGGFMAHRLACELSTEIAGIVSLAGMVWNDATKCNPTDPVAVLQVHGDADETILYGGGSTFPAVPIYPSAAETVLTWAKKNGCGSTLANQGRLDLVPELDGDETRIARHDCSSGAAELWTIEAGGHIPRFNSTWAERIYGFLDAHPKP
jgi:polyhydroxybutyrate depolymerase